MKKQVGDELVEMTAEETKIVTDYQTAVANKEQELEDKAALRVSVLKKLGLTTDEIDAILG